jgi:hypothetical protein
MASGAAPGKVFIADDLATWVIGLAADAGRRKLTSLLLGSEKERALSSAAAAAVQRTAEELHPGDVEQAEQLAMVISEVFSAPVPREPLAGRITMLEALQAGIARQLTVVDDASLTDTGQSAADVPGPDRPCWSICFPIGSGAVTRPATPGRRPPCGGRTVRTPRTRGPAGSICGADQAGPGAPPRRGWRRQRKRPGISCRRRRRGL